MNYFVLIKLSILSAERAGFEPAVPFWSTHTFQACSLNHSDISPNAFQPYKPSLKSLPKVQHFFIRQTKNFVFLLQQLFNCLTFSLKASSRHGWNSA